MNLYLHLKWIFVECFQLPFLQQAKQSVILLTRQRCGTHYYVSVISKPDHPSDDLWGFARSHCPEVGFLPNFHCLGGRGFKLEKFSTALKEKCRNFLICFIETGGSLKSRCSYAVP